MSKDKKCCVCLGESEALLRAFVKGGCIVVKNEIQDLCGQHWISCEPIEDEAYIMEVYDEATFKAFGLK